MRTLYQFPISHYCEKVRWALDHKQLDYRTRNLLPGLHARTTKKLAAESTVPVLVDSGKAIQDSSDIIDYLDSRYPDTPLTPGEQELKEEAQYWEKFADERIGVAVRAVCYDTLLDHPGLLIPIFTANGPWYGRPIMPVIYPKLRLQMRKLMMIEPRTVKLAQQRLEKAIDKIDAHLKGRRFMVGDRFTRADIAVASFLAPLCKIRKFGVEWPAVYPEPLESLTASWAGKLSWVERLYQDYR